ncbi:cytochrome b561 domain-containing protein 2-like isoform X2 [Varroa jacobsoni]|nr:cytochrome b561 domain-containing protein 2-like isoform X2 [Varroa jacobsoni]
MFEAIQIFNKSNPLRDWLPIRAVTFHWLLATITIACISGGMFIVYEHKESLGKAHFTSLHSKFGLIANLGIICVALGGILTLYRKNLNLPVIVKQGHVIAGVIIYIAAVGALLTGLSSNLFSNVIMQSSPAYWRAIYVLPILCGFVIVMQVIRKFIAKNEKSKNEHGKDKKSSD